MDGSEGDQAAARIVPRSQAGRCNTLLSRFYRELSVNLMMQVIRGGKLEGGSYLPTEHAAIVDAYEAGDLDAAHAAIRTHIASGRRIALEAIEDHAGVL